jgi:hypothetical protein
MTLITAAMIRSLSLAALLCAGLAACAPHADVSPTAPVSIDAGAALTPTRPEPTPSPTPEPFPTLSAVFYPSASQNFAPVVQPAYQGMEMQAAMRSQSSAALDRLLAMGFEREIDQIQRLYREELVRQTGLSEEAVRNSLEWEYHLTERSWLTIPRDRATGRYWMPVITDASCGGGTGRKIDPSMATTLNRPECAGDFFDLEPLESAGGLGNTRQVILKDGKSGWFVFGEASAATQETLTWYDMKKPKGESWTPVHTFRPSGAAPFVRVVFQEGEWVALKADGSTGWRFNPDRQEWEDTAPKNFVELIELKKREFEERTGQSVLEAMEKYRSEMIEWSEVRTTTGELLGYRPPVSHGGFYESKERGNYFSNRWAIGAAYMNLGCGRISLENVQGSHKNDYALVMIGARLPDPELGQTDVQYMPFIAGAVYQGQWGTANNVELMRVDNDNYLNPFIRVDEANNPQQYETWINSHSGELAGILAYLRFRNEGDWKGIHVNDDYGLYRDAPPAIKKLMDALEGGYIQRFTQNPSLLGATQITPSGRGGGEFPTVEQVYTLLDPNKDIGLFVDRLAMGN